VGRWSSSTTFGITGRNAVGGIQIVGGISKLGSNAALSVLTPEFLSLVPGLLSTDAAECTGSIESLLRMCHNPEPSAPDLSLMPRYNAAVPPYVRQALFARSFDSDDLMPKIRKPVLITHGTDDAIVKPVVVDQHKSAMPHAQVPMMPNAGHAPSLNDAQSFNQRLRTFAASLKSDHASLEPTL
jgi:non-heme chloroperoxidase